MVADALSRLDKSEEPIKDNTEMFMTYMECLTSEGDSIEFHPLNYQHLQIAQTKDNITMKILKLPKTLHMMKNFHGGGKDSSLVCYKDKIVIPKNIQKHVINWYHTTLCHPGINRTEETIAQHLWWKEMRNQITLFVKACPVCQRQKRKQKKCIGCQ